MAQVAKIWENLYLGMTNIIPLPRNYQTIKTWKIGDKIIQGQISNQKILNNGNIQKRITTLFRDGKLGLETKVYAPDGELLKAYAGIRTTKNTIPNIESASEMYKMQNLKDAKML